VGTVNDFVIQSVTLTDEGTLEVVKRYPSHSMFACNPPKPVPDRVVKEIYTGHGFRVRLCRTVEGKHIPASRVSEKIEFD
jgi:hypothetical protein